MDDLLIQIIVGSYGGFLLLAISILTKLLWTLSENQTKTQNEVSQYSYVINRIEGQEIPTIRIQIQKMDERTDDIEHRTDKLEAAIGRSLKD